MPLGGFKELETADAVIVDSSEWLYTSRIRVVKHTALFSWRSFILKIRVGSNSLIPGRIMEYEQKRNIV